MLGWSIVLAAATGSLLFAGAIRLRGLVSSLLAAYLVFVWTSCFSTVALCVPGGRPDGDRDRPGGLPCRSDWYLGFWRGAPSAADRRGSGNGGLARTQLADAGFLVLAGSSSASSLLLVTTAAPNNWDGFAYHLARVAAWAQHGGIYWIANPPSDILNTRRPVAEQQIFFFFATLGKGRFFALPQYLAQLAGLVAVRRHATARFGARVAACTAIGGAAAARFRLLVLAVHAATRASKPSRREAP